MTRMLTTILDAPDASFRMQLRQLERLSGHTSQDIRLSIDVLHAVQAKVHHLGLDKHDTTPEELYHSLIARVTADDARLERTLRTVAATKISAEANVIDGMRVELANDASQLRAFGIKSASLKRLLKAQAPKKVQKQLGYRSLDAMLRGEQPSALVAAARVIESAAWRRQWRDKLKKVTTSDFETKQAAIVVLDGKRWLSVTEVLMRGHRSPAIGQPETGAVVLLPLPAERPAGMVVATMATALQALNDIAATSTYLQASQVQADFGERVQRAADGTISLHEPLLQHAMPWRLVQQYFVRRGAAVQEDVFGPFVQQSDLWWQDVEARLAALAPSLEFWHGNRHLTFLNHGQPVSLNLIDAAVSACNQLSFNARSVTHAQQELWHELAMRYISPEHLEQTIIGTLRPQLAPATAHV